MRGKPHQVGTLSLSTIRHSGDLIDVSNDIGVHISVKMKNQDKMFDALEISKNILKYQPIVFGGSNGIMEH